MTRSPRSTGSRSATSTTAPTREVVRPGRCARRRHRPAGRARHLHRRADPPGLPRRRHRRLAHRRLRRTRGRERPDRRPRRHRRARPPPPRRRGARALAIDVFSISMGYYHETPEDLLFDPTMYDILRHWASAASRWCARPATTPPPARCSRRRSRPGPTARAASPRRPSMVPIVSVGALNPNGTDALFSNAGPWVRALRARRGADQHLAPLFQGGLEPAARTEAYMRVRESIDPDDFTGAASPCGAVRRSRRHSSPGDVAQRPGRPRRPRPTTAVKRRSSEPGRH